MSGSPIFLHQETPSSVSLPKSYSFPDNSDINDTMGCLHGDSAFLKTVSFLTADDDTDGDELLTVEEKCSWLRSQVLGAGLQFETPFGKRTLTYADHTASGRALRYVEGYIADEVLPSYGNTHTDDSHVGRTMTRMAQQAATYVKRCMGGGAGDAIVFCGSGATAAIKRLQEVMGVAVASSMRSRVVRELLRAKERWVVFVGPYEHHSNLLSWRESLAEVVEIGVDEDGLVDMSMLKRELESPDYCGRPMLGSFSACSNVTGIHADTRALARLLHHHGAFACFDFAASGPYVQIDMQSGELEGYDAVFLSPHKFVGGPGTPGVLLMSEALYCLRSSPPSTCGGGTVDFVNGFDEKDTLYHEEIEEREDAGTPPIIQKIRAALAFWVKEYMGHCLIQTQENLWLGRAFERLLVNPNIQVLGNTSAARQPIISFLIHTQSLKQQEEDKQTCVWRERVERKDKPLHGRFVTKLLNDLFGIQARGGCACAGPYGHILLDVGKEQSLAFRSAIQKGFTGLKPGWTRVSFVYYMSATEFEFILAAIEFLATYGQRFLPLYSFNWKTGDWTFRRRALQRAVREFEEPLSTAFPPIDRLKWIGGRSQQLFRHEPPPTATSAAPPPHAAAVARAKAPAKEQEVMGGGDGGGMEQRYAMYMESALYVAKSLPKFPPPRRVPEGVDADLILFRI